MRGSREVRFVSLIYYRGQNFEGKTINAIAFLREDSFASPWKSKNPSLSEQMKMTMPQMDFRSCCRFEHGRKPLIGKIKLRTFESC